MPMHGLPRSLFQHSLYLMNFAVKLAGSILDRKQCRDFRRLEDEI